MRIIRGITALQEMSSQGQSLASVVTIGNFDGVHLGHQTILGQLKRLANLNQVQSVAILFEPQPQEYFIRKGGAPARLTRFIEKVNLLDQQGVDCIVVLRFTPSFAQLSADEFVKQILVQGLRAKHVIVGDDFCFGRDRQGNFTSLVESGRQFGFRVENTATFSIQNKRVSSTWVRASLQHGNFQQASRLLGRDYGLSGRVIHGHKRGRTIGFPTANIPVRRTLSPLNGVYAVQIHRHNSNPLFGVANIGSRPTVDDDTRILLEVHIFDFNGDLYGQRVEVVFQHKIRAEQTFSDFEALKTQISIDCQAAKDFFAS